MNSRHLQFCREVAAGKSQAEAYRTVYPRSRNWKDGTARKRASELMKRGDVSGTIEELRREADAEAIMDCQELRTILTARVRELKATHAPTIELCRASDSLARVSGWYSPAALAVAVAPGPLTQEERERRINDILGIPNDTPEKVTQEEKARRIRDALGIPEPTPEERERKWRELLGIPPADETPGPQTRLALPAPRSVEAVEAQGGEEAEATAAAALAPVEVSPEPEPVPVSVPATVPESAPDTDPAPVAVEEDPARRERLARILAFVERKGAATREEARALALTFEGGSVIGSEARAVAELWEAAHTNGDAEKTDAATN